MLLKEMFTKPIDREMQGVIVVGQDDNADMQQELEEYVVTQELQKHFRDFFTNYKKGIVGTTPKMGVWISGFFGSGKSHFLKMLAYLLENQEVCGKTALDYFIDDNKIEDAAVLADMKLAAQTPTDVILFNIASKSDNSGNRNKDAIVNVFLRVFNEMQGFCGAIPWIADLERKLTEDGRYDEFKRTFEEIEGESWEDSRDDFDYAQDSVVETLSAIQFMSKEAARNWCEKAVGEFHTSIEDFAKMVQKYLARQDTNHHIVFAIDEVGQYIGDDSQLMLDLQTITEELGKDCTGKVWIVVTSQQDIDTITKVRGNDFSKIQGRFDTRLSLSSANVDVIIKKRILEKTDTAASTLRLLYDQTDTVIKNLITFNDSQEKKLYAGRDDFAAVYPFIPYQFNLLANVLNSVRMHGASGKHLSQGERSMLAMFKEAAMTYMDSPVHVLIPLYAFYDAMENFLDHSHRSVITKAYDNSCINPNHEKNVFAVNVLKTLFLIKYIQDVMANADNLTSLMITSLDDDRVAVRGQVEKALHVLISQNLVQKNGDTYIFLTDEEQEINREINNENIEMTEVIHKVAELIFDDIFKDKAYRYPKFNGRYAFTFSQKVDDEWYKVQKSDITVHVLTPAFDGSMDEMSLRIKAEQENAVLIVLPNDRTFMDELLSYLKIGKFLRSNTGSGYSKFDDIKFSKNREMQERQESARLFLTEALKEADIYVNSDKAQITSKDVSGRMQDALGRLVQNVYSKLSYIDTAMDDADIQKALKLLENPSLDLGNTKEANSLALNEVLRHIAGNTRIHIKTSMKMVKDYFMKAPYHFVENDIQWLIARLFKRGDLTFSVNGDTVNSSNKTARELFDYITKKQYAEKLMMEQRTRISDKDKRMVKDVIKELFHTTCGDEDEDAIMNDFMQRARGVLNNLNQIQPNYAAHNDYPGWKIVHAGRGILQQIQQMSSTKSFFALVKEKSDDLLDFAEDWELVQNFFAGEQKTIFDKARQCKVIYEDSKTYIDNQELEDVVAAIHEILAMPKPYRRIPELPELTDKFDTVYVDILEKQAVPVRQSIQEAKDRVFAVLADKPYKDQKVPAYDGKFAELFSQVEHCNNLAQLRILADKADAMKIRLLDEMSARDVQLEQAAAEAEQRKAEETGNKTGIRTMPADTNGQVTEGAKPYTVQKKSKHVRIKDVTHTSVWQLQSPQDVDTYVATLKKELLQQLDEDTIVNIEF